MHQNRTLLRDDPFASQASYLNDNCEHLLMDLDYWDQTLQNYSTEVVSVFDWDTEQVVAKLIRQLARSRGNASAADMGCGVGQFTELLAGCYARVESCDFSTEGLCRAQARCRSNEQVHYHQHDLTTDPSPFDPVDLVLCINVLMMPSLDQRLRAWRTVTNQVRQHGHLLLVVPALESILMERHHALEHELGEGHSCQQSLSDTLPEHSTVMDLHQGVHRIEQVRTKHYLKSELKALLAEHHFTVEQVQPLSYRKNSGAEMLDTWDWLVLAQRN